MATETVPELLWEPNERYLEQSRVLRLMRRHGISTYEEFYNRSIEDIAWFWDTVAREELELESRHERTRTTRGRP